MNSASNAPRLRFYTRANCSLCEKVYPMLERVTAEGLATVERINIAADPDLTQRYGARIPVLEFPDGQLLEGRISEFRIRRILSG